MEDRENVCYNEGLLHGLLIGVAVTVLFHYFV